MTSGDISDVIYDVIVVREFCHWSKATVVDGDRGFPRVFPWNDVISATCEDDSEADDENEAGGNGERRH